MKGNNKMILEGLNNYYKCKQCAKQFLCKKINNKVPAVYYIFKTANELGENCKQIKFSETKNYGEVKKNVKD